MVKSIVPGHPDWVNIKYDNDEDMYVENMTQHMASGDMKMMNQ